MPTLLWDPFGRGEQPQFASHTHGDHPHVIHHAPARKAGGPAASKTEMLNAFKYTAALQEGQKNVASPPFAAPGDLEHASRKVGRPLRESTTFSPDFEILHTQETHP
jgi:hypothetical protein